MRIPTGIIAIVSIAAVLLIAVVAFTLEPLWTLVGRTPQLPPNTIVLARIPPDEDADTTIKEGIDLLKNRGVVITDDKEIEKLAKTTIPAFSGVRLLTLQNTAVGLLPISITFSGLADSKLVSAALHRLAAFALPINEPVTLPDGSTYIEIVADPTKSDPTQLAVPINLSENGDIVTVTTSTSSPTQGEKYLVPLGCRKTKGGMSVITFGEVPETKPKALFKGISPYIGNFSCFQTFSTFVTFKGK